MKQLAIAGNAELERKPRHVELSAKLRKRRIAFLGTGYIAGWHAQAVAAIPHLHLVAVCDRILPKAKSLANRFGVPSVYSSLEEMLRNEDLDAVHVLLPPDRHFDAARTILSAGVDVFLEKPMCTSADQCEDLVAIAEERGLRIGVGHNFLFSPIYEKLRYDLNRGMLGRIDYLEISWNRELPLLTYGPFNSWMLRDPRNILLEVGSHAVSQVLDLAGAIDRISMLPSNPAVLPTGQTFYRRWQINAFHESSAIDLRFSFVPGFAEYRIHLRGSLASATVDFERNTYVLGSYYPSSPDFANYSALKSQSRDLAKQARRTLFRYLRSKLDLGIRGNPYGESIVRSMESFYAPGNAELDRRISGSFGANVIRTCSRMSEMAELPHAQSAGNAAPSRNRTTPSKRILVLGGTGFIGKELVRRLSSAGHGIRLLTRNPANLPMTIDRSNVECVDGDLSQQDPLLRAFDGVSCVVHLARSNVQSWAEYQEQEIGVTRRIAECALKAGVERLVYTGTIASYYQGARQGTITEATPLDARIARGNFYARAKTESEKLLFEMHRQSGLPVVVLRPGIVIGRGGNPFHWGVGMWWQNAICQTWGNGNHKLPFVLVEDVADALISAMLITGIEGRSFNLVGDPCLSAGEYLDELDRCAGARIRRIPTPIYRFYAGDLGKWLAKTALRYPPTPRPTYRDWETRTLRAPFDCSAAKSVLGWRPISERAEVIRLGIEEPVQEFTR